MLQTHKLSNKFMNKCWKLRHLLHFSFSLSLSLSRYLLAFFAAMLGKKHSNIRFIPLFKIDYSLLIPCYSIWIRLWHAKFFQNVTKWNWQIGELGWCAIFSIRTDSFCDNILLWHYQQDVRITDCGACIYLYFIFELLDSLLNVRNLVLKR